MLRYLNNFTKTSLSMLMRLAQVAVTHVKAAYKNPKNALGLFISGPLVGWSMFLANRPSVVVGGALGLAAGLAFGYPFWTAVGLGLGANIATGFLQSVHTAVRNQEARKTPSGDGKIQYNKFPDDIGPVAKGLHFNFRGVSMLSFGKKSFGYNEIFGIPQEIAGLEPIKPKRR